MVTERSVYLVLTANVPYNEIDFLIFYWLNVEFNSGNSGYHFAQLKFIQNSSLNK